MINTTNKFIRLFQSTFSFRIMLPVLFAIVFFNSCKKDNEDTTAPVIKYIRINGITADEHTIQAGSTISVDVKVTDDKALNQVKINIHPADDGHSHGGNTSGTVPNVGTWSDNRILSVNSTSDEVAATFNTPVNISGYWHVEVLVLDESGNEAEERFTTLHVENSGMPEINITTAPEENENGEIILITGQSITVFGQIVDSDGISAASIELISEATGVAIWQTDIAASGEMIFDLGAVQTDPVEIAGHYELVFHCTDGIGFNGIWSREVIVE